MEISRCVSQHVRRRLSVSPIEYSDKGHMRYYCISSNKYDYKCCLKMKKKKKKKIEEEEEEEGALRRKVKVKSLMEVERLEQMRAEEKQQKRMRKRVKRMTMEDDTDSSSSSSSSSSSEDDERKTTTAARIGDESAAALLRLPLMQQPMAEAEALEASVVSVCVGNKCKKMGAESLLAELQRSTEMVVAPCKCMGKCKSAPNVKLLRADDDDDNGDALFTHVNLNNLSSILHKQCQLLLPA